MPTERPILLIDARNLFIRNYVCNPAMSTHGHHMGGTVGFLSSFRKIIDIVYPSRICVIWEGGGNSRRRALFSEYKSRRKPPRLNRFYEGDIPDTAENHEFQIKVLIEFLKYLPICQLYVSDSEADDVIGYLCRHEFHGQEKVILSSDKDFYQLLDETTRVYSLTSKEFVTEADLFEQYGITAQNFCLAKALNGDSSDGIPGIKGIGFKTALKRFPALGEPRDVSIDEILETCQEKQGEKIAAYKNILEGADILKRNWRLMYLDTLNLSADQIKKIRFQLENSNGRSNKFAFLKKTIDEGIGTFDSQGLFMSVSML